MACASRDLISVVGAGVSMIELLLSSTVRMILSIPDGAIVGIRRMRNLTPWLRFGLLKFVSCALARLLFGSTTRSLEPLRRWVERHSREYIRKRALQGEPQDDGENTRSGYQGADRHAEDVGDDRQRGADIDHADDQVLDKPTLARETFQDQEDPRAAGQQPGGVDPPDDLGEGDEDALDDSGVTGRYFPGNDVRMEKQGRKRQEKDELHQQTPARVLAQQD